MKGFLRVPHYLLTNLRLMNIRKKSVARFYSVPKLKDMRFSKFPHEKHYEVYKKNLEILQESSRFGKSKKERSLCLPQNGIILALGQYEKKDFLLNALTIVAPAESTSNFSGEYAIAAITLYVTVVALIVSERNHVVSRVGKFDQICTKIDDFIQKMLNSHFDSYSFIEKTDRIPGNIFRAQMMERQVLERELESQLKIFTELKLSKSSSLYPFLNIKNLIETTLIQIDIEKLRLRSYQHISSAMFYTEINNYKEALGFMFQALESYANTVGLNRDIRFREKTENLKFTLLNNKITRNGEFITLDTLNKFVKQLEEFNEYLSQLYRIEYKVWFSDILNYFGYIIFDNLGLEPKEISRYNYSCMFPVIFFLNLSAIVNPNNTLSNNNLGYAYGILGNLDMAEDYIQASIGLNSTYALSQYNLGLIYDAKGKIEKARDCYVTAAKLVNPRSKSLSKEETSPAIKDFYKKIMEAITNCGKGYSEFQKESLLTKFQKDKCAEMSMSFIKEATENAVDNVWKKKNLLQKSSFLFFKPDIVNENTQKLPHKINVSWRYDKNTDDTLEGIGVPIPNRMFVLE